MSESTDKVEAAVRDLLPVDSHSWTIYGENMQLRYITPISGRVKAQLRTLGEENDVNLILVDRTRFQRPIVPLA